MSVSDSIRPAESPTTKTFLGPCLTVVVVVVVVEVVVGFLAYDFL